MCELKNMPDQIKNKLDITKENIGKPEDTAIET
jgi:hypothetical protein